MQLPNVDRAIVSRVKIVDYLLNPLHPEGAGKATFFGSLGFTTDNWQLLAEALKNVASQSEVAFSVESAHGQKYIIEGEIDTPSGRRSFVRTVWIIDIDNSAPRLVTAYPCGGNH